MSSCSSLGESRASIKAEDFAAQRPADRAPPFRSRYGILTAATKRPASGSRSSKPLGFVSERPRRAYDPAVLFLTRKSFEELCQRGTIDDLPRMSWPSLEKRVRVSPLTLQHELEVQDVRAAFYREASKFEALSIERFSTWPVLSEFRAFNPHGQAVTVKPNGFIRLHHHTATGQTFAHLFFLELDPQETLVSRAHCYRDFYQRGGLAVWHGRSAEEFSRFPFRVIIVFKNPMRHMNTATNLLLAHPPILSQVWLTTLAELLKSPFGPIWLRPIDYRQSHAEITDPIHREQSGRLVPHAAEVVTKHRILS